MSGKFEVPVRSAPSDGMFAEIKLAINDVILKNGTLVINVTNLRTEIERDVVHTITCVTNRKN